MKVKVRNGSIMDSPRKEITSAELGEDLREALAHLYDPDFQPSEPLCRLVGCDSRNGALAVQSAILRAIESVKPPPSTPSSARTQQVYKVLHGRFVLKLTRAETAELLHMSVSSVRRAQREATHALTRVLSERGKIREPSTEGGTTDGRLQSPPEEASDDQTWDWRSQARRELDALRVSSPDKVSNVGETISGVLELGGSLISLRGIRIEVGFLQPNLVAAIHPSVLRQLLITALGRLARYLTTSQITIYAGLEDGNVVVTLTSTATAGHCPTVGELTGEMLVPENVSVGVDVDENTVFLSIEMPSAGSITVLVVDDNPDVARFYRRCTAGTSYRVVHISEAREVFGIIEAVSPDMIVLDIMMPDVDGWQLLMQLHENPVTRVIPVIVCSVVREEHLALSLGAALYLPKPVRPRDFIDALDQVRPQASTEAPISPVNNRAAC